MKCDENLGLISRIGLPPTAGASGVLVGKHMSSSAGFAKRVEKFCKERQDLALLALVAQKRNGGIECYETKPTMPMADDLKKCPNLALDVFVVGFPS
nr:hypothetical protein Iba_chr12eCG0930 [Ipomoea batatas]